MHFAGHDHHARGVFANRFSGDDPNFIGGVVDVRL